MSMEKAQPRPPEPEGCLTAFVRIPVRVVVLVVVVPVRMVWDVLVVCARAVDRALLRPLGRALGWIGTQLLAPLFRGVATVALWVAKALFVWPWVALWRYVLAPVGRYGIAIPSAWLYRHVLTPLGHGIALILHWVGLALFVWPWVALWRYVLAPVGRYGIGVPAAWLYRAVLTPLGHALVRLGKALFVWPWVALWRYVVVPVVRYGIVVPLGWLWRCVLAPLGREIADAFRVCWRVAGHLSRAVGRALAWMARNLVGRPVTWFYRGVCTPVGHWVRDSVWTPARTAAVAARRAARGALASARATVRQARRDAWHALVGGPRVTEPGEPVVASTRTLGSTTTASGAAPAPEISLRKRG